MLLFFFFNLVIFSLEFLYRINYDLDSNLNVWIFSSFFLNCEKMRIR